MEKVSIEVFEAKCKRCLRSWNPVVEHPKQCSLCKSPYWDKERRKTGTQGARNKYGFDELEVGKWKRFPWFEKDDGGIDVERNSARARSLEQYMRRHGYRYEFNGNEGRMFIRRLS